MTPLLIPCSRLAVPVVFFLAARKNAFAVTYPLTISSIYPAALESLDFLQRSQNEEQ
jgi:hypothetical protein